MTLARYSSLVARKRRTFRRSQCSCCSVISRTKNSATTGSERDRRLWNASCNAGSPPGSVDTAERARSQSKSNVDEFLDETNKTGIEIMDFTRGLAPQNGTSSHRATLTIFNNVFLDNALQKADI